MTTAVASLAFIAALSSGSDGSGKSTLAAQEHTPAVQASSAQTDADRIRQRVKEGQKVRITDDQGREWHGRIGALAPDTLTLVTKDRQQKDVPYPTILSIERPPDTLANGALIGLASGAVFGLLGVIAEENADCEPEGFFSCGDPTAGAYIVAPLVLGGFGTAIGVGIDALVRRDPNLFRRSGNGRVTLAPALGRGVRVLTVSVRW
jgi:hypothetical protein